MPTDQPATAARERFAQVASWPFYRFWLVGDRAIKVHDRIMRWGQKPMLLAVEEAKRNAR